MTPILYKANETDFYHKGIGSLEELSFVEVTEEENGDFSLELEYPTDGRYFNSIEEFMFIKAKPNDEDEPHIFRIYEIEKDTIGLSVTVFATSKTITDLQGNMVRKVTIDNETPQQAFNKIKINLIYPTTYDFYSDIGTKSSTEWIRRNPLNCIAGEEGSLLQYWGGEIKRGNQIISLLKRRGKDNVATIRYGKNLKGLVANFSVKGMVTRVLPHFTYTPEGAKDPITVEGNFVDSQYINNYPIPFIREVDFSNDDDVKDLASLNAKARQYFTENVGIDKPSVTMDIQIEDLFSTNEYSEKFKKLEKILLFDTVTVYHKKFDISITAKVNKLVYDPYREKNVSLEVGSTRNTLLDDIKKDTQYQLNEVKKELNYVSLSADGKNRINYGSATPSIANKNDLWFKPNGEFTIMYRFDGVYWQPIIDTEDLDKIAQEVSAAIEQADLDRAKFEQDIEAAKQSTKAYTDAEIIKFDTKFDAETGAIRNEVTTGYNNAVATGKAYTDVKNAEFDEQLLVVKTDLDTTVLKADDAVLKANKSIEDVGFMKTDLDITKANAIDALTKAQTATESFNTLSTSFDELTQTVGFKAEQTTVDAVTRQVDQHELSIAANAQAITARLTSTQVDSLVSAKGYVNQAQLTATSTAWSLALTQVSTDLSNLEIGGTNLLIDTKNMVKNTNAFLTGEKYEGLSISSGTATSSGYKDLFTQRTPILTGLSYTASFYAKANNSSTTYINCFFYSPNTTLRGRSSTGQTSSGSDGSITVILSTEWKRYWVTWEQGSSGVTKSLIIGRVSNGGSAAVAGVKFESGSKNMDWSPAPEDLVTLEQFTTIDATVKGLQTTVGNKADKTQVTQLATQWTQTTALVNGHTGQISNLGEQINLRVTAENVTDAILKDKTIKDTRNDNQMPSWYQSNYPKQSVTEFKTRTVIGVPGSSTYVQLTTKVPWTTGTSGGVPIQVAESNDGTYQRVSNSSGSAWLPWDKIQEAGKVLAQINLSTEGVLIAGKRIQLDGDVAMNAAFITKLDVQTLKAVTANIATIKTQVLTADVVTSVHLKVDNALIDKLTATTAVVDYLFAKTAFVNNLSAKTLTAITANITSIRSQVLTANVVDATMLKSDTAMINKLFATTALVDTLTAKTAFINSVKAIDISADRVTAGTLNAAKVTIINLDANRITSGSLTGANLELNLNTGMQTFYNPVSAGGNLVLTQGQIRFVRGGMGSRYINYHDEGIIITHGVENTGYTRNTSLHLQGDKAYLQFISNAGLTLQRLESDSIYLTAYVNDSFRVQRYYGTGEWRPIKARSFETSGTVNDMEIIENWIRTTSSSDTHIYIEPSRNGDIRVADRALSQYHGIDASRFRVSSERRFKSDITEFDNALSLLNTLTFHEYTKNGEKEIGLIADEAPLQLLSAEQTTVDLYSLISIVGRSQQELSYISYGHEVKLDNHENRIKELEKENKLLQQKVEKLESAA